MSRPIKENRIETGLYCPRCRMPVIKIYLNGHKYPGQETLVSALDYPYISDGPWKGKLLLNGSWSVKSNHPSKDTPTHRLYATRSGAWYPQLMQMYLTGYEETDHINHDTLLNCRCNLRDGSNGVNANNRDPDSALPNR